MVNIIFNRVGLLKPLLPLVEGTYLVILSFGFRFPEFRKESPCFEKAERGDRSGEQASSQLIGASRFLTWLF